MSLKLIGQTLDEKYRIERELGRGGMGAVYLATHVGTERAVALKVIAPEFMRREEFVERFRREARAAGRLRHPNVVDVTDFGLAETDSGRVAYLVMEYLDGCTLGEVLEEENRLPLSWTLDILEQTCSAVDEAHRQGIIHRDLKPDNIWLEPNARGGYTVKVLDFGIAKLEEMRSKSEDDAAAQEREKGRKGEREKISSEILSKGQTTKDKTQTIESENQTLALSSNEAENIVENQTLSLPANGNNSARENQMSAAENQTLNLESLTPNDEGSTLSFEIQNPKSEIRNPNDSQGTLIFPAARATAANAAGSADEEAAATKILTEAPAAFEQTAVNSTDTAALTRVGAVLGTPLYMSPEQCRGERLDARADIYSLGVIAYQMLSGATPFSGKYTDVLEAHKLQPPPALETKKVPRGVKRVVASAMAKRADERPATALALATKMRAHSEGIGELLRRAMMIYSQHLPTFLGLAVLLSIPGMVFTLAQVSATILRANDAMPFALGDALSIVLALVSPFVSVFFSAILTGVTTWLVAEHLAVPLRPVRLRPAFQEARKHLRTFAGTVMLLSFLSMIGLFMCFVPGLVLFVLFTLLTPVVMMEGLRGRAAARRSIQLARRSLRTVTAVTFLHLFVPMILALLISLGVNLMIAGAKTSIFGKDEPAAQQTAQPQSEAAAEETEAGVQISVGNSETKVEPRPKRKPKTEAEKKSERIENAWSNSLFQILWQPIVVLIGSFASVVTALLYLKTRQAGGEATPALLEKFETSELPQSRWQQRVKERLVSGRQTGRTSAASKT